MAQLANFLQLTLDRIQRLQEITAALSGTLPTPQIAELFISQGITNVGASAGAVAILIEDNVLELAGSTGLLPDCANLWQRFALDTSSPIAEAIRTQQAIWIESLAEWNARYPTLPNANPTCERWAALPLIARGQAIGTIAFSFAQPTPFTEEDKVYLSAVAYHCAQMLDRAQRDAADQKFRQHAEAERTQVTTILENITDGFVSLDQDWHFTYINREAERILGNPREKLLGQSVSEIFADFTTSPFFQQAQQAIADQQSIEFEQFATPINKWLYSHIYPFKNGVSIYFQDITERKRTEQALRSSETRFQHFINANLIGVIAATNDGQITEANDAFLNMVGYTRQDLEAGRISWVAMTPPEYLFLDEQAILQGVRTGVGVTYEKEYIRKDGSRVPILIGGVLNDGVWLSFIMDLTDHKRAEMRQRFLAEASSLLSGLLDDTAIFKSIAQLVVPTLADWCIVDILRTDNLLVPVAIAHLDPDQVAEAYALRQRYPPDPLATRGIYQVIRSGRPELYTDVSPELLMARAVDEEHARLLHATGYTSMLLVPLTARGRTVGALTMVTTTSGRHYTEDDLSFASDLAQRTTLAVENARLYAEAQQARRIAEMAQQRQAFLIEASAVLATSLDYETTLATVAHLLVPRLADWCAIDMWQPDHTLKRLAVAHIDPNKVTWAYEMWERYPIDMNASVGLPQVLRTGQAELYPDISEELLVAASPDPQQLAIAREIGYSSVIVMPLIVRGQVIGGINLVWAESKRHYTQDDLSFAQELAQRAAVAIDNAQLYRDAQEQREQMRVTLASIGDAVIATNTQGRITFMNGVAESLTGWAMTEIVGQPLQEVFRLVREETHEPVESPIASVLSTGSIVRLGNRSLLLARNGVEIPIDDSAAPIRDDKGQTIGIVLTFRDISDRRKAASRLRFLAEVGAVLAVSLDYEITFQNMAQLLIPTIADNFIIDLLAETGELRRVTLAASEPEAEAALREMRDRYPPDPHSISIRQVIGSLRPILATEIPLASSEAYAQDAEHLAMMQRIGTISYIVLPLIVRGLAIGVMSIGMANSGRRYSEDDVKFAEELARRAAQAVDNARLYQEAQDAIRIRETFLTIAAHELRTPITSIVGTTQLLERHALRDNSLPPADLRLIQTIKEQTKRLTAMIQALLDVSRIERGQLTLERHPVDLRILIERIIHELQPTLTRHNIDYAGSDVPLMVDIDEMRIEQAIQNLIGNAIKYSPRGGVIQLRIQQEAEMARLAITDSGIGIPRDALSRLFTQFYRASNADVEHISGIGIGLYLVQETVVLHGGRVEVESEEGRGSTFTLYLPLAASLP